MYIIYYAILCRYIVIVEILKCMFGFQGHAIDFSMYFKNKARSGHRCIP